MHIYAFNISSYSHDMFNNLLTYALLQVRVPSWTDRILFKIQDVDHIDVTLHSYESLDHINSSDHKPVKAHLCLTYTKPS